MIAQKSVKIIVTLLLGLVLFPFTAFSNESKSLNEAEEEFNATEMIMHHIGDAHGWHFW